MLRPVVLQRPQHDGTQCRLPFVLQGADDIIFFKRRMSTVKQSLATLRPHSGLAVGAM